MSAIAATSTERPTRGAGLRIDQVHAHKGASAVAPENTLSAFRSAYGQGARWVEFDVSLLGDGTPVVIHDATVDRCSSSTGHLKDLSLKDLDAIDAGSWFDPFYQGERIPTLAEALECFAEFGLSGNLEIKRHKHQASVEELTGNIHAVLKDRDPSVRISISSFDVDVLKSIGAKDPSLELAMLWDKLPENWRDVLADIPTKVIHLNYKALTLPFLDEVVEKGLLVRAWTCNDPAELAQFWSMGLGAVITDEPRYFLSR
ncbi:glycerophosphoryl diester phosphodiesterase [Youhaiella tibetensis]|uniref:Glycerophosphoryl diester phosphodiesterase n=1 Tax=Paradevosia tibetensis TaxID=1447062 RepID=A0A5B9DMX5_9HYPH|nr:glycerophosphodiester phosphodiesterase family protein [Youhaiella tibetensis]QEE19808.1 glycerophosphoryl diester phosphodiesterase [Youhaiella tibetensis]GGF29771.1 glycerophosphoryl diester phosphodiesterase [Youhaiella tibetensis]